MNSPKVNVLYCDSCFIWNFLKYNFSRICVFVIYELSLLFYYFTIISVWMLFFNEYVLFLFSLNKWLSRVIFRSDIIFKILLTTSDQTGIFDLFIWAEREALSSQG